MSVMDERWGTEKASQEKIEATKINLAGTGGSQHNQGRRGGWELVQSIAAGTMGKTEIANDLPFCRRAGSHQTESLIMKQKTEEEWSSLE